MVHHTSHLLSPNCFYHLLLSVENSCSFLSVCVTLQPPVLIIIIVFQSFFLHFFLFEAFPSVLILPSSSYFFDFSHATSQSLHHCSPILTAPTSKSTSWFTRSIVCYTICRCSHITWKSYFSLLVYVNKMSQLSTTIFLFCT